MGFLDAIFKRNSELGFIYDAELLQNTKNRVHMKRLAIEICASFLGRTISQSEFRVINGAEYEKNEIYFIASLLLYGASDTCVVRRRW